jgi:hypothetical protein
VKQKPLRTQVSFHVLVKVDVTHVKPLEPLELLQLARQALPEGLVGEPVFLMGTEPLAEDETA